MSNAPRVDGCGRDSAVTPPRRQRGALAVRLEVNRFAVTSENSSSESWIDRYTS